MLETGQGLKCEMEVDSRIKQRYIASPLIFKLVTYKIIEEMKRKTREVRVAGVRISSLFFADDGMMLAEGVEEARRTVKSLREEAEKYGLEMNIEKSKCLMFNMEGEELREIEGMEVVKELEYLGVKIEGRCNLYEGQRKRMLEKGKRMSNMTYSVIEKSCHRVLIGKAYWKSVVLAGVLFGG